MRRRAYGQLLTTTALALAVGGCQPNAGSSTRPTTLASTTQTSGNSAQVGPIPPIGPSSPTAVARPAVDPKSAIGQSLLVGLDAYVVSVPAGSVSRNDAFWKRVNEEDALSPAAYSLLSHNGVRVGLAALDDWPFFKEIIDQRPAATQLNQFVTLNGKSLELEMKKDVATQNIWRFDAANHAIGRTYDYCENLWSLSFQPVAREPEKIYVSLTPLVRSQRKRLEVITHRAHPEDPPTREIAYSSPEYLFDLGLEAIVPPGKFLVVAPSAQATGGTVGEAFLKGAGMGQQVEKVLLLVPRQVPATVTLQPKTN